MPLTFNKRALGQTYSLESPTDKTHMPPGFNKRALGQKFRDVRKRSDQIFSLVKPEAYYERPLPLRNPIFFYDGHLDAFNWNTLFRRGLGKPALHSTFDDLFARGIDPANENEVPDLCAWPSREEIQRYKKQIVDKLHQFIEAGNFSEPKLQNGKVLSILLEHELMHQETLLYILKELPLSQKNIPQQNKTPDFGNAPRPAMIEIPKGETFLGAQKGQIPFGWDNEFEGFFTEVETFSIDQYPVTNKEFLAFLEEGGYQNRALWSEKAWNWLQTENKRNPQTWKQIEGKWYLKNLFETILLPHSWPVSVTFAEAEAYATWAGKQLPTEAQWQRAAYADSMKPYPWGEKEPDASHGNFGFQLWSRTKVGNYPAGKSPFGVFDLLGNGWEWTQTPFAPFESFQANPVYPEYSADFFDQKHYVLKGGGPFTDQTLLRRSLRNWFYWNYLYADASFRCVSP